MRLDFIPESVYQDIFGFSKELFTPYNERISNMGYESHNLINNLGSIYIIILLTILLIGLSMLPHIRRKMDVWHHF